MGFDPLGSIRRRFGSEGFGSNVARIAGGTALGQGLVILAMPIITRLYTPDHFGLMAVYVSILSMVVVVACLRFEVAIPLPAEESDAAHLLVLTLISAAAVGVLTLLACLFFGGPFLRLIKAEGLHPYLAWVLPVGVVGTGAYQAMSYWAMRQRDYSRLARTRVHQGIAQAVTQVGLGFLRLGPLGLLAGADVGRLNGTGTLMRAAWKNEGEHFRSVTRKGLWAMIVRYREFPLVSAGSALLNAAGLYLPAILITAVFNTHVSGQFSLSQRAIAVPMALVGQAIAQVYTAEASLLLRTDPAAVHDLTRRTMRKLFLLSLGPVVILALMGPWGFKLIFGKGWGEAGLYVRILCPMFLLQFMAVPLSQTLNILEHQTLQLAWDAARLVAMLVAIYVLARLGLGPLWVVSAFGVIMTVLYALMLWLVDRKTAMLAERERVHAS